VHENDLGVHRDELYICIYMVVYVLRSESLCDYEAGELGHK
jgi:hypothetical protein